MKPWQEWLRIVLIGAVVGLLYWVVTVLLARYVIEPLTCRELTDAMQCLNAGTMAGNVATVITGLIAVAFMVNLRVTQPVIIAAGSAAVLWGLGVWTSGLWWLEAIAWSILLYSLCFGLFAWIGRSVRMVSAIIISVLVILIIRIALVL